MIGQCNAAQIVGEQALKIDGNFAEAHNNLGSIYLDQGRSEDAVRSFQRCIELVGDNHALAERYRADHNKLLAVNFLVPERPEGTATNFESKYFVPHSQVICSR